MGLLRLPLIIGGFGRRRLVTAESTLHYTMKLGPVLHFFE